MPNKPKEAKMCYGTSSLEHPGVQMISMERGKYYLGGKLTVFELPKRYLLIICKIILNIQNYTIY